MSHSCEFCGSEFSSRRSLLGHQKKARYCVEKQGKIQQLKEKNKCACGSIDSNDSRFRKHVSNCTISQSAQTIINNNNNIVTNNLVINIYGSTFTTITAEEISKKLIPLLMRVVPNLPQMCQVAADNLVNENGNPLITVPDASRDKFVIRYDNEDKEDNGGLKTCSILRPPFQEASLNVYEKDGNKETLILMEKLHNKQDTTLAKNLMQVLPKHFTASCGDEQKLLKDSNEKYDEFSKKFQAIKDDKMLLDKKEKKIDNAKKFEQLQDDLIRVNNGLFRHKIYGYMVEMIHVTENKYRLNIQYKRRPDCDTNLDLTEADLECLTRIGALFFVDARYDSKIKKLNLER